MVLLKRFVVFMALFSFVLAANICSAESSIPNLLGTWTVKSQAAFMSKGSAPGAWTHHTKPLNTLIAEAVFTRQEGRLLYGTFTSQRATEHFIAVIGMDNKSIYYADQDGYLDGQLINNDKIQVVYRHASSVDTVVALGVWTRKK